MNFTDKQLDFIRDGVMVFVGWFLGFATTAIVEWRKERKEKRYLQSAIATELDELQFKAMGLVYLTALHFGEYTKDLLQWLKPIVDEINQRRPSEKMLTEIDTHLTLGDSRLRALGNMLKEAKAGSAITYKKYELPFLETVFEKIQELDLPIQQALIQIRSRLQIVNEEISTAVLLQNRTFDSLTTQNYATVRQNLELSQRNVGIQTRVMIDLIRSILPKLKQ